MKDLGKEIKTIKIIYQVVSVVVIIIGLLFSYIVAELDDAPGVIIIGTTLTIVVASFIYGFGEMIIQFKKNNALLFDIYNEIKKKK